MDSKIVKTETVADGRFLRLENITYNDENGQEHKWEACQRKGSGKAVSIIAIKKQSNKLILIREFRPPMGTYCIGFPAGLVDDGESIEETAKRELLEETGYTANGVLATWQTENSAGLTGEVCIPVIAYIDEESKANLNVRQNLQDNEQIQVLEIPCTAQGIYDFIQERLGAGDVISTKLTHILLGMDFARMMKE